MRRRSLRTEFSLLKKKKTEFREVRFCPMRRGVTGGFELRSDPMRLMT